LAEPLSLKLRQGPSATTLRIRQLVAFRKCTLLYKPDCKLRSFSATSVTALSTTADVLPQFAAYGLVLS
jgi:hypothetical protein